MQVSFTTELAACIAVALPGSKQPALWPNKPDRPTCVSNVVVQIEMAKAGVNLFVEKPLSVRPAAEVAELAHQLKLIQDKNK